MIIGPAWPRVERFTPIHTPLRAYCLRIRPLRLLPAYAPYAYCLRIPLTPTVCVHASHAHCLCTRPLRLLPGYTPHHISRFTPRPISHPVATAPLEHYIPRHYAPSSLRTSITTPSTSRTLITAPSQHYALSTYISLITTPPRHYATSSLRFFTYIFNHYAPST